MNEHESIKEKYLIIEERIGYQFQNKELLLLAFTHSSYTNEHAGLVPNERLEFLGDSVLSIIVSKELYVRHPEATEGKLSHLRSQIVDANACAEMIETLELEKYLLLGKGEKQNLARSRKTLLSDLFEALIGAIYLDGGYKAARTFFFSNFGERFEKEPAPNYKAMLQDFAQRTEKLTPEYRVISEEGPDHEKTFTTEVIINGNVLGSGTGSSKKEAEISAAKDVCTNVDM
ncbi:MAG: Ribonuclease 3 [Chlamydiia bacterium]|nr:Ribonuclease 3 [Chlamydiia bacterium]MCH9614977.1 Ribonuclease 3 [Chlamydiia bacterium]MCH9629973.1 Ribonuclease 3 [Chlamydiia bacterium]